jgi:hypothetical protein
VQRTGPLLVMLYTGNMGLYGIAHQFLFKTLDKKACMLLIMTEGAPKHTGVKNVKEKRKGVWWFRLTEMVSRRRKERRNTTPSAF